MVISSGSKRVPGRFVGLVTDGVSFCVFAVLDIVDQLLCPVFALLDSLVLSSDGGSLDSTDIPGKSKMPTEATKSDSKLGAEHGGNSSPASNRLKSKLQRAFKWSSFRSCDEKRLARWSDCGCEKCMSWQLNEHKLYVHVDDKDFVASHGNDNNVQRAENNVVFLHGFLSSSSFWTDSVMPALPQEVRVSHRLFALDILGFGKSPKPSDCFYTLADHVDIIERSLLQSHGVQKFHLVAHSMGCIIALALAAQFPAAVKSLTLLAPPYYPATPGITPAASYTIQQLAPRRIWPLVTFGSAVMSWYEHIGRVVCLVVCKNHRFWEPILTFLHSKIPGHRTPLSSVADFTKHTHHSAWHLFHNTICSGVHAVDHCFEELLRAGRRIRVIHGTHDSIVPFKQSEILSCRHPGVLLSPVLSANHASIVFGRESELASELAQEFELVEKVT
ncbi:hypothetical protein R1flu_000093 [Riccia fluitans]|uniref:AB hydrolase-1 domain-containing protein n=1 Tax=Riccia fluitans TaxID=41844 RepID=A0ABD1XZF9_9MARC